MTDLSALAERIEAAEGPDRNLDAMIHHRLLNGIGTGYASDAPAYTASLDAAVSLVPDRHRAGVLYGSMRNIQRTGFSNSTFLQRLILEVAAAAIRARSQGGTDNG